MSSLSKVFQLGYFGGLLRQNFTGAIPIDLEQQCQSIEGRMHNSTVHILSILM